MFDDVFGMATLCAATFRDGVHDAFGSSIAADVLEPILKEINSLRIFDEEFQRQSFNIDKVLEDARIIQYKDYGHQK